VGCRYGLSCFWFERGSVVYGAWMRARILWKSRRCILGVCHIGYITAAKLLALHSNRYVNELCRPLGGGFG
jgi:hypothetical protein